MSSVRTGKTLKDRKSGATQRRLDNRQARVDWQQDFTATSKTFPRHACNGKKNRFRYTGKGNTVVFH